MNLRRRMESEIERDISEHIEMETRDNIARGMAPAEARLAALRKFGNPARVAEDTREVWRWMWADRLALDTRYALRTIRRNPAFAAVAILTLALGIGMNTAVFSVVSAALIKPLPYPGAERIVWLANSNRRYKFEASSAPDFSDWRHAQSFEQVAGYNTLDSTLMNGGQSDKYSFVAATPEFWGLAGARPALGRLFTAADRDAIVLSWKTFEHRFGADPHVVGRVVLVDGRRTAIIGVLPKDFRFLPPSGGPGGMSAEADVFEPFIIAPELQVRGPSLLLTFVVGKVKAGLPIAKARAEIQTIQDRVARENPAMHDFYAASELHVVPLQEKLVGDSRRALLILLAAVAFVLLIACANLGNLLLARVTSRQREIAIRAAIGAGRSRLLRQFLVEGLTLTLLGAAAGLALARGAIALLIRVHPGAVPRLNEVVIDWRVLLFTGAVSVCAGIVFALAPLLALPAGGLYTVLKEGGRGASAGAAGLRLRRLLVAVELSLALVLLTGAGLMVKSFARMNAHPAQFEPGKIALMKVWLSGPAYRQPSAALAYTKQLLDRLGQVPGVQVAAVMNSSGSGGADIEGPPRFAPGQAPQVFFRAASASYPRLMGIPLIAGRWTTDEEPVPAVMVNQTFVRRVFGSENPLGHRLKTRGPAGAVIAAVIVGVVGDLKVSRLDADPDPEVLVPIQYTAVFRRLDVLAKAEDTPAAILPEVRRIVQGIDPTQPPYGVNTLEGALADTIAPRRFNLLLLGSFAATAVLLALIGIYGLMSYAVTQRTREIGVRMALGAGRGEIVAMVVGQGMSMALAGIGVGTVAALGLTRLMDTLLFDVKPNDPWTFALVAVSLTVTALLASWIPALRAARVDPIAALRDE
jgi:putative ABC transport system permease protein